MWSQLAVSRADWLGSDHLRYVSVASVKKDEELFVEAETQTHLSHRL